MNKDTKKLLKWVALACATDGSRPMLNHMYVTELPAVGGGLYVVASDGYRAHVAPLSDDLTWEPGTFVDSKTFKPVTYEGRYPDVNAIIEPQVNNGERYHRSLSNEHMTQACKLAAIFSRDSANSAEFKLFGNGVLSVYGKSKERGDCRHILITDSGSDDHTCIAAVSSNIEYVLDALKNPTHKDTVPVSLASKYAVLEQDDINVIIIGNVDNGAFSLIMPMVLDRYSDIEKRRVPYMEESDEAEAQRAHSATNAPTALRGKAAKEAASHFNQDTRWSVAPARRRDTPSKAKNVPVFGSDDEIVFPDGVGIVLRDGGEWKPPRRTNLAQTGKNGVWHKFDFVGTPDAVRITRNNE